MDYFEGGDLQGVIDVCRVQQKKIHPLIALMWSQEIVKGMKICHENDIIHRDLKPENVLVKSPFIVNDYLWAVTNLQLDLPQHTALKVIERLPEFIEQMKSEDWHWCCVTDSGLSKRVQGEDNVHVSGPPEALEDNGYIAPELMKPDGKYSTKSDIFTLGGLLYHLFQGEHPFPEGFYNPKYKRINNILYPANIHAIVTRCLQEVPSQRPTVTELTKEMAEGFVEVLRQFEFLSNSFITQCTPLRPKSSGISEITIEPSKVASRWPSWSADEQGVMIVSLFEAVSKGKASVVKDLLSRGVNPMCRDTESQTPLHCAVIQGNLEIVKLLFEYSIDVNVQGKAKRTALHLAAQANHTLLIEFLINKHAYIEALDEDQATPLMAAATYGSIKSIDMLLKYRAKINTQGKDGKEALHYAASKNRPLAISSLLEWGADIEARTDNGETPLLLAAISGSLGTVKALGLRGANLEARDNLQNRALHMAASNGCLPIIRYLLENGAKADAEGQYERQPIHCAALKSHTDVAEFLVREQPECVFALDEDHATALHYAADKNHVDVAKLLLAHGASPLSKTRYAKTPRDMTLGVIQWGMRKTLKEAEAMEKSVRHPSLMFLRPRELVTSNVEIIELKS